MDKTVKNRLSTAISIACLAVVATPIQAQSLLTTPFAISQLVTTACLFDTMNPATELPRSHAAFAASGMAKVLQQPTKAIYGDMGGTYFISNLTDDNNIACAAHIAPADLNQAGFDFLVQQIEGQFRIRYGNHIFAPGDSSTSWIAKHGNGTKTVMSINYNPNSGTSIASVATIDD
jgi:hypothetical protein